MFFFQNCPVKNVPTDLMEESWSRELLNPGTPQIPINGAFSGKFSKKAARNWKGERNDVIIRADRP